ncbi:AMP-dependent synthetase [Frateuria sp. Soil773]|uniref:salicylate synthase n=1 Tax=Frateuria sp. Soil773 TaxID=1736407 RepID=UPI0006F6D7D4|nr:salicylate synthase [Frateuria sp. Soil773]KRE88747.1 AMP-dependent synthetase [Frateuria sp. Soil773]
MESSATGWPASVVEIYERAGYWQPLTLGQHLRGWAAQYGERIALMDGTVPCSYAGLDRRADRLAAGFAGLGIGRGDRVLLQLPNGTGFVVALFALFRLGAIPLLAMPSQRLSDLDGLCALAEPVACIVPDRFLGFDHRGMAEALQAQHPGMRHLIVDGDAGGHLALDALEAEPLDLLPAPHHRDVALLLQSGGTTGTPKLIPRTHADYAYNARASAELCGLDADTVYLAALPIAHNFPLACPGLLGTLSVGGRVVMARTPGSDETFALIARERVNVTALVPPLVQLWLQAREWDDADLSSLRLLQVGGARLEPALAKRIAPELGCRLQQVFGMAEGLLCYTRPDDPDEVVQNTQGRPLSPEDELRIVDAQGRGVAPGETGELLVRGPYTIRGYYRAAAHNAVAFTADGYYRSGDLVRRTADGNLVVEGRLKEQINRAGEKIATAEIEQHLREHPRIRDAVLVAVRDAQLGERSCAFVLAAGDAPDLRELHDFLRQRGLPRHKLPDQLETVRAWPLTTVGKIDKRRLAAQALQVVASAPRARYREQALATATAPLELAARIARALDGEPFTVYERDGEWSIGIGTAAEITVDAQQVRLDHDGERRHWPVTDFAAAMKQALDTLPIDGWRLYGTAHFELARLFHGLGLDDTQAPLLRLAVPAVEIRLRQDRAMLRALDESSLPGWAERLARLDALPAGDMDAEAGTVSVDVRDADAAPYRQRVAAAVRQIDAREYHKVILSRRVPLAAPVDVAASYLAGRRANQPARSFLLGRDGFHSAGFSPETVVEVSADGRVSTQPLAGTRALGADDAEEARLRRDLLNDPKEIAEHAASVKLAFEELGLVCAPGSIQVSEFMDVCRRGSVQHLASRVQGRLGPGRSAWDAFRALFPAVTASGIPKREAIEAIGRHEPSRRGLYSGCVMIADSDGALDAALVLRSVYQDRGQAWLQAGAGVVAMSTPERELEETCEKLASVSRHLVRGRERA